MRRAAVFALALVGNAVLGSQKDTIRGTILSDDVRARDEYVSMHRCILLLLAAYMWSL